MPQVDFIGLLQRFAAASVLVLGDVMLDEYVWGDVRRISPEAPVPVLEHGRHTHLPGGAANAAANIASLSARTLLGGVVGVDHEAESLRQDLVARRIIANLLASNDRPTTTKTRVIGGTQQILRIDREEQVEVSPETESALLKWASEQMASVDGILVSDYGKGVVTSGLCQGLLDLAREWSKPFVVDPKGRDYSKYSGATVVTPNVSEVHLAAEPLSAKSSGLEADIEHVQSVLGGSSLLVTRGSEGVSLFRSEGRPYHVPARKRNVFDVTGAGDTLAATLALCLASGGTLEESAIVANAAGGLAVGKIGTGAVSLMELESEMSLWVASADSMG